MSQYLHNNSRHKQDNEKVIKSAQNVTQTKIYKPKQLKIMVDLTNIEKLARHIEDTYSRVGVTVVKEHSTKLVIYENHPTGSLLYLPVMSKLIDIYELQWYVQYNKYAKQCVLIVTA